MHSGQYRDPAVKNTGDDDVDKTIDDADLIVPTHAGSFTRTMPGLFWAESTTSTQTVAVAILEGHGHPEGPKTLHHGDTFAVAEQTAGRGRRDRGWGAAPGESLALSLVIDPAELELAPEELSWVTLFAGAALVEFFSTHRVPAGLKWPNDVLTPEGKKLVGILATYVPDAQKMVLGIGINIHFGSQRPVETAAALADANPDFAPENATYTLAELSGVVREYLLSALQDQVRRLHNGTHLAEIEQRMSTLGQRVRAILPGERELIGTAAGLGDGGMLLIDDDAGARHEVSAADVVHLRRPDSNTAPH